VVLAVATVGLGLNLRAWTLLGPRLAQRADIGPGRYVLLIGLPVLVAALARLPLGVLTDRYGARVMFPVVSMLSAASVLGLALAGSLPAVVVAGAAAGVAGTSYVVGAALVSRTVGYGRRGLALGIFSLGTAVTVGIGAASWDTDPVGRRAGLALGAGLIGFAGLAALLLPGHNGGRRAGSPLRQCIQMVRLASATSLSLLYALALGGVVASAVYLPSYLMTAFDLPRFDALAVTSAVVGLATLARLAGGWWTDRRPTARLLLFCYATAACLCLTVAVVPPLRWLTAPLIAAIAICGGVASGALLALIGKAAQADSVGAVMGATGAAATFGTVGITLLLAGVQRLLGSYSVGWVLLGAVLLAVSLYVRAYGLRVAMGLAVRSEPDATPTATTIAVVDESDTRWGAAAVVARLAELATSDELVVVYGSDAPTRSGEPSNVLTTGLRDRLPRHSIVTVHIGRHTGPPGRHAALFTETVESGAVAVALTPTVDLGDITAQLSTYLQADRVLKVSYTLASGADLYNIWDRRSGPW
jgi:MFS transporter, NNP family, nitrate/nitrite transporter